MKKIAITGNIGSGKTTVCKVFESLGIRIYYADREARKFYQSEDVIQAVKSLFGNDVFTADDQLIAPLLAERAFADPAMLNKLNGIIHPLVLDDFRQWAAKNTADQYILYESALLFESGFYKHFDISILVTAPLALARKRVMKRDGIRQQDFDARLNAQWDEEKKKPLADHIIANDEQSPLIPRLLDLHRLFTVSQG